MFVCVCVQASRILVRATCPENSANTHTEQLREQNQDEDEEEGKKGVTEMESN